MNHDIRRADGLAYLPVVDSIGGSEALAVPVREYHKPWLFAPLNVGPFETNRAALRHPPTPRAKVRYAADPRKRAAARRARVARRVTRRAVP